MPEDRPLIECIFCGTVEPRGDRGEDIIPGWYARAFHGPGKYSLDMAELTTEGMVKAPERRFQTAAGLRLADVCQQCNNEWMGTIERVAAPILTPMMQETGATLTMNERRIVATWCQLKAVTLDALYPTSHLPSSDAHEMLLGLPLMAFAVKLGRLNMNVGHHVYFARRHGTVTLTHQTHSMETGQTESHPVDHDVFRVTFAFAHLAFEVASWLERDMPVEMLAMEHPFWVGLWPPEFGRQDEPVVWPPRETIEGLDGLRIFL